MSALLSSLALLVFFFFFFFNDTATTEIYTLSLHDALPISISGFLLARLFGAQDHERARFAGKAADRKSTRLNSSHTVISYAVFCLKKKTCALGTANTEPDYGQRQPYRDRRCPYRDIARACA